MSRFARLIAAACAAVAFVTLYWPVLRKLVSDWGTDDNYSHGFFIVPLAAYFTWERRHRLAEIAAKPTTWGLPVIAFGLGLLVLGTLGAELFLTRISMLWLLAGAILFLWGRRRLQALTFPMLFLLLMIPLPALVFNQIAFPLQLLASRCGEAALMAFRVPVLREGNVIVLANATLEVAEACSGIRSLVSLIVLGLVYGYFAERRGGVRTAIVLSTIPIAIVANGIRVAGTGLAAHFIGPEAAEGFLHTFSGWLMFGVAFIGMVVVHATLTPTLRLIERRREQPSLQTL
jgi:exosortase